MSIPSSSNVTYNYVVYAITNYDFLYLHAINCINIFLFPGTWAINVSLTHSKPFSWNKFETFNHFSLQDKIIQDFPTSLS